MPEAVLLQNQKKAPELTLSTDAQAGRQRRPLLPRLALDIKQGNDGSAISISPRGGVEDHAAWLDRVDRAFGTCGSSFSMTMINRLLTAARGRDDKIDETRANALLAVVEGAKPQNEIEALLAVQIAIASTAGMHLLQRAMDAGQVTQFDSASNAANKLMRTAAVLAETLAKLQRGGAQTVKVVHVHSGGNAVIGNVATGASGTSRAHVGRGDD